MFKLKKSLASALALSVLVGTMPFQSSAEAIYSTADGYYTTDSVVAKQYYTPETNSMCNGVFAADAEVIISGDTATITLYVANPTPAWGGLATGILSNFSLVYDDVYYPGTTTVIGYENDNAPVKSFSQESSFFGIEVGDKLACDKVVIPNVPVDALEDDMMHLTAFVNLVMNSQQDFWMDFSYVAGGPGEVPEDTGSTPDSTPDSTPSEDGTWIEEKQVAITATVSASEENAPSYAITIPTDVPLGEISSDADTTYNYSIGLDLGDHEEISISVAESGTLTSGSDTLAYTNTLNTTTYTANSTATGQLTIAQANGAAAAEGNYSGILTFNFTIS